MQFVVHPNRSGAFALVWSGNSVIFSVDSTNFVYHLYTSCFFFKIWNRIVTARGERGEFFLTGEVCEAC